MKPQAITTWYNGTYRVINRNRLATNVCMTVVCSAERSPGRRVVLVLSDGSELPFKLFKEMREHGQLVKEE